MSRKPAGGGRFVAIGRVLKPRGLGGEAFLHPLSDFPERFQELSESLLQKPDGNRLTLAIDHVRTYGRRMAIKFAGIDSPEAVAPLRGSELLVSADQVYRLPDDTFYVFEIVGLKAETEAGAGNRKCEGCHFAPRKRSVRDQKGGWDGGSGTRRKGPGSGRSGGPASGCEEPGRTPGLGFQARTRRAGKRRDAYRLPHHISGSDPRRRYVRHFGSCDTVGSG